MHISVTRYLFLFLNIKNICSCLGNNVLLKMIENVPLDKRDYIILLHYFIICYLSLFIFYQSIMYYELYNKLSKHLSL